MKSLSRRHLLQLGAALLAGPLAADTTTAANGLPPDLGLPALDPEFLQRYRQAFTEAMPAEAAPAVVRRLLLERPNAISAASLGADIQAEFRRYPLRTGLGDEVLFRAGQP